MRLLIDYIAITIMLIYQDYKSFLMKGIELPINVLIIIAVAVIVLIAIIAMFYPAWTGGSSTMTIEGAKSNACQILTESKKCSVATSTIGVVGFDANKDANHAIETQLDAAVSAGDTLSALCDNYYQINAVTAGTASQAEIRCKQLCGCSS
jgi:hypothetical protein